MKYLNIAFGVGIGFCCAALLFIGHAQPTYLFWMLLGLLAFRILLIWRKSKRRPVARRGPLPLRYKIIPIALVPAAIGLTALAIRIFDSLYAHHHL